MSVRALHGDMVFWVLLKPYSIFIVVVFILYVRLWVGLIKFNVRSFVAASAASDIVVLCYFSVVVVTAFR